MRFLRGMLIIGLLIGIAPSVASADTRVDLFWQLDSQSITRDVSEDPYQSSYIDSLTFNYASYVSGTDNVFPNGMFSPAVSDGRSFWGLRGNITVSRKESLFGSVLTGANGTSFNVDDDFILRVNGQVSGYASWVQAAGSFPIPDSVWYDGANTIEVVYWNDWNDSNGYLGALYLWLPPQSTPNAVPEPATVLLLGLGLAGVAVARRKFRR